MNQDVMKKKHWHYVPSSLALLQTTVVIIWYHYWWANQPYRIPIKMMTMMMTSTWTRVMLPARKMKRIPITTTVAAAVVVIISPTLLLIYQYRMLSSNSYCTTEPTLCIYHHPAIENHSSPLVYHIDRCFILKLILDWFIQSPTFFDVPSRSIFHILLGKYC